MTKKRTASRAHPGRAYGSSAERAYGILAGELRALDEDIAAARAASRVSVAGFALSTAPPDRPTARRQGEEVGLGDGAHLLIRPIEPGDVRELERALQRLGALSRYEYFRTEVARIDPGRLAAEARVDHRTREALVALDARSGDGVGLARYVCDAGDPARAEIACAVMDSWQGRGVGTALLRRLLARARDNGVQHATARMFVGNERARRLLARVAEIVAENRDGGVVEVTLRLAPPGSRPDRPAPDRAPAG